MSTRKKKIERYLERGTKNSAESIEALELLAGGPLTLGRLLLSIRLNNDVAQADFAKKLKISKQALCDIEKGRRAVNPEKAARFADALGHPRNTFVRLALQSIVDEAGLKVRVDVA